VLLGEEGTLLNELTPELLLSGIVEFLRGGFGNSLFGRGSVSELFNLESVHHGSFRDNRDFRFMVTEDSIAQVRGLLALLFLLMLQEFTVPLFF
jgi:hypothetical protein